ncbi:unnamed protein product [Cuscuta campestris]|uniref:DUF8039 domain-containing protein n=1 Tax=Cuscuta campestris TaxID=132261 RepID=A0A484KPF7_9ASTE|nr:unnamed protein product [Cuscuta campestris]
MMGVINKLIGSPLSSPNLAPKAGNLIVQIVEDTAAHTGSLVENLSNEPHVEDDMKSGSNVLGTNKSLTMEEIVVHPVGISDDAFVIVTDLVPTDDVDEDNHHQDREEVFGDNLIVYGFTESFLLPDAERIHEAHKKRIKENKYPHLLSRKGYANMEMELSEKHSEEESELDRSIACVLARKDKHGHFKFENVKIPVPIDDEVVTVQQAINTFVAWPKEFVVIDVELPTMSIKRSVPKKNAGKKMKKLVRTSNEDYEEEFHVEFGPKYPFPLKHLWLWEKDALADDRSISFQLSEEAFAIEKKLLVFLSDIHALCSGGDIAGSIITIYLYCLYEYVKKYRMLETLAFVDPGLIGSLGCGNSGQRSRNLADWFMAATDGQYFIVPSSEDSVVVYIGKLVDFCVQVTIFGWDGISEAVGLCVHNSVELSSAPNLEVVRILDFPYLAKKN